MSHLTIKQTKVLKEMLMEEKTVLDNHFDNEAGDHDSMLDSSGELSAVDNHPADVATEVFERSRDQAIDQNLEHQLSEVNDALSRIDSGAYGVCQECGMDIPFERLQAIPYTAYCIEHVTDQSVPGYRPVEEDIMEPGRGAMNPNSLTEQSRLDDNDAWKSVEQYGNSDSKSTTDKRDKTILEERMGTTSIKESML